MSEKTKESYGRYFGAANTYSGFKSYFDEIFDPKNYNRIYVIKGGPGTGKSSLMKKILSQFSEKANSEAIYCSSDPNSLDGVIIENNGKRIALLDGTSPHETDAKVPGAVDEIINLGEFWDKEWLIPRKDRILDLNKEKKNEYKTAYKYLSIAGECSYSEKSIYKEEYNIEESRKKALELAMNFERNSKKKCEKRLVSSFGKSGSFSLGFDSLPCNKHLNLDLSDIEFSFFMNDLKRALDALGISYIAFPYAPDIDFFEAFYIKDSDTLIGKFDDGESIDLSTLCISDIPLLKERTRVCEELKTIALQEAQRHFSIASELHFSLEEIYSSSMNFSKMNMLFEKIKAEIEDILF